MGPYGQLIQQPFESSTAVRLRASDRLLMPLPSCTPCKHLVSCSGHRLLLAPRPDYSAMLACAASLAVRSRQVPDARNSHLFPVIHRLSQRWLTLPQRPATSSEAVIWRQRWEAPERVKGAFRSSPMRSFCEPSAQIFAASMPTSSASPCRRRSKLHWPE